MAITHADLAPSPRGCHLGSRTGAFLMVLSICLGLLCFILCLVAEASRTQIKWETNQVECSYTGSGKIPLLSSMVAFFSLAVAMSVQHVYLLAAVSRSDSFAEVSPPESTTWQAGILFVTTWTLFAAGMILLLIGLSVESGHLKNWEAPRSSCLVIAEGVFTASGVLGLVTVFLASGLYVTALRIESQFQEQRQEMLEISAMHAFPSPPPPTRSPDPLPGQEQNVVDLHHFLRQLDKVSILV